MWAWKPIAPSHQPDSFLAQVKKPTRPGSTPSPAAQSTPAPPAGAQAARVKPTPTPTPSRKQKPVAEVAAQPIPPTTEPLPAPAKQKKLKPAAFPTESKTAAAGLPLPSSPKSAKSTTRPAAEPGLVAQPPSAAVRKAPEPKPTAKKVGSKAVAHRRPVVAAPATIVPEEPVRASLSPDRAAVNEPPSVPTRTVVPRGALSPLSPLPPLPALLWTGDPAPVVAVVHPATRPAAIELTASASADTAAAAPVETPVSVTRSGGPAPSTPEAKLTVASQASSWTGSVWILARDPFTLVVHWDLPLAVVDAARAGDSRGQWRLRVWQEYVGGPRVTDQLLPLDATHRFVPVVVSGAGYVAEIGFLEGSGRWRGCAISQPILAPRETSAHVRTSKNERLPEVRGGAGPVHPVMLLESAPDRRVETAGGVAPSESRSQPSGAALFQAPWTVLEALQRLVQREGRIAEFGSSDRMTEWSVREAWHSERQRVRAATTTAGFSVSVPEIEACGGNPSSAESVLPTHLPSAPGFWFRINAEVILYGSTERDAQLTIAGRPVALREDGSFSFRFLLPDGRFDLPVVAVNATRTDGRSAVVMFSRATSVRGEVGPHPAPPGLKPPVPDAI